jgi:hypothetical protein
MSITDIGWFFHVRDVRNRFRFYFYLPFGASVEVTNAVCPHQVLIPEILRDATQRSDPNYVEEHHGEEDAA